MFLVLFVFLLPQSLFAKEIIFTIPEGTSAFLEDWNSPETPVMGEVGDTLIIVNGDSEDHRLHTNGTPCPHSPLIKPGESWSCTLNDVYDAREEVQPTRDHFQYESKFWIVVKVKEE